MNDWVVKSKKTGDWFEVLSTCSDGTVELVGKDSLEVRITRDELQEDYEPFMGDLSTDDLRRIISQLQHTKEFRELHNAILRRLHPGGYFKVGDLVHFTMSWYTGGDINRYINFSRVPFKITDIYNVHRQWGVSMVRIKRYSGQPIISPGEGYDYEFPMYSDKLTTTDAFYCLRKYGSPY